jgi:hypothetical protein
VDDVHLLLNEAALTSGHVRLGAPENHEAVLGHTKLGVLLGTVCWFAGLRSQLLGLALLAKGAMDVAPVGSTVLEEVLRLPCGKGRGPRAPSRSARGAHPTRRVEA